MVIINSKKIDRKCFEPLKSIEVLEIVENEGLNAISFIKPSLLSDQYVGLYVRAKVKKYGSISGWEKFLRQFPQLGKR